MCRTESGHESGKSTMVFKRPAGDGDFGGWRSDKQQRGDPDGAIGSSARDDDDEEEEQKQPGGCANSGQGEGELPGPNLGAGPRWDLARAAAESIAEGEEMELFSEVWKRCIKMLEQALSGSGNADVEFVLAGGGHSGLRGHRGMLCAGSEAFDAMFRSGMVEAQESKIRMPPGISIASYRGFLEWLYLGRAGEECAKADGRELWVLGEMYQLQALVHWLEDRGIDLSNFGAAFEFLLVPEGIGREEIQWRCEQVARMEEYNVGGVAGLKDVGKDAVAEFVKLIIDRDADQTFLYWKCSRGAVRLLTGWMRANCGADRDEDVAWFRERMEELSQPGYVSWKDGDDVIEHDSPMLWMPLKVLRCAVEGCEYLDEAWVADLFERKRARGDNAYQVEFREEQRYNFQVQHWEAGMIAIHGEEGPEQLLAIAFDGWGVKIVNAQSGQLLATAGEVRGLFLGRKQQRDEDAAPHTHHSSTLGVAFSPDGELYVSDSRRHRILVYDRQGKYLRGFGELGDGDGQFKEPVGICFTSDGKLIVCDSQDYRVQILRPDGSHLGSIVEKPGMVGRRRDDGQPCPRVVQVCAGVDGGGFVVEDRGRSLLRVHDAEGVQVGCIKVPDPCKAPTEKCRFLLAVGRGGEIITQYDNSKEDRIMCVCSGKIDRVRGTPPLPADLDDVGLQQMIGQGGDSSVDSLFELCQDELAFQEYPGTTNDGVTTVSRRVSGCGSCAHLASIATDFSGRLFLCYQDGTIRVLS